VYQTLDPEHTTRTQPKTPPAVGHLSQDDDLQRKSSLLFEEDEPKLNILDRFDKGLDFASDLIGSGLYAGFKKVENTDISKLREHELVRSGDHVVRGGLRVLEDLGQKVGQRVGDIVQEKVLLYEYDFTDAHN